MCILYILGFIKELPSLSFRDIARGKERIPIPVTNDVDSSNYPTDFTYVMESVSTAPVPVNTMISSLSVSWHQQQVLLCMECRLVAGVNSNVRQLVKSRLVETGVGT